MPPAFGDPAGLGTVADGDADEILRGVADTEVRERRIGKLVATLMGQAH